MTHPDLPKKFGHRPRGDLADAQKRLAERLARADVAIEVNTSGLRKPVREIYPSLELLTMFQQAGVPATLSSDSHRPQDVGADYDRALEHLRRAGYREYVAFCGRRRERRPLPD
jgi:histidinol-phosphatase (PHP family)